MGKQSKLRRQRAEERRVLASKLDILLKLYQDIAPRIIYSKYRADCCLSATRITIEVLSAFGFTAWPMTTSTMIMNAKMFQLARLKGDMPDTKEELDAWVEQGAWALGSDGRRQNVALQPSADPDGWAWHLVALVNDEYIVDASSRQMNRPERDIIVGDIVAAPMPKQFASGDVPAILRCENGTVLTYKAEPSIEEYKVLQGYRAAHTVETANEIIIRMHDALKRKAGIVDPNSLV